MGRCCCLVSVHPIGECMNLEPEFLYASDVQVVGNWLCTGAGPCRVPDTLYSSVHVFFVHPLLFITQYCKQSTQSNKSSLKA